MSIHSAGAGLISPVVTPTAPVRPPAGRDLDEGFSRELLAARDGGMEAELLGAGHTPGGSEHALRGPEEAARSAATGGEASRTAAPRPCEPSSSTAAPAASAHDVQPSDVPGRAGLASEKLHEALRSVAAQQRGLDQAIELARSGKTFSPQELLALQARAQRFSFDLNVLSKAVEQVSSGVKKTLDTQI